MSTSNVQTLLPAALAAPSLAVPIKVLLVDDNADVAELLGEVLQDSGHHVCVAHHGKDALRAVATFAPDVALLDLGLPGMTGYELAEWLRIEVGP